ncbi:putative N-acetyltransferase san [Paramyrothecium foliicola]|nr:putative N-acetyltransferase san [Paramyrothecium foliicola]
MTLPTAAPTKSGQLSIRAFFPGKTPNYAPPPSQKASNTTANGAPPASAAASAPSLPPSSLSTATTVLRPLPPSVAANLPSQAAIRPITVHDTNALRRINALLLPVAYPDAFYQRAVDPTASGPFSRVITWAHPGEEPKVVGGVVCRVEPAVNVKAAGQISQTLYIQSLCLLSPYRSKGLINAALESILATASSAPELSVKTISAHVWTENEEGLHWYENRGFQRDQQPIKGYYVKLRPDSAWLVHRQVRSEMQNSESIASSTPNQPPPASTGIPSSGPPPHPSLSTADNGLSRPPPRTNSGQSYQNQRPETEWNDLPADMATGLLVPPKKPGSEPGSGTSSRSSSTARKKRDRSYPAAAFGN